MGSGHPGQTLVSHWPECLGEKFVEARGEQVIAGMQPHLNSMRSYEKQSNWMLLDHGTPDWLPHWCFLSVG